MRINQIQQNKNINPTFNMALFEPTQKHIAKAIGKDAVAEFESARPALLEIAKDINIYIQPFKNIYGMTEPSATGFMMFAGDFKSEIDAQVKLIKKLYGRYYRPTDYVIWVNSIDMSTLAKRLVASAEKIKAYVKK